MVATGVCWYILEAACGVHLIEMIYLIAIVDNITYMHTYPLKCLRHKCLWTELLIRSLVVWFIVYYIIHTPSQETLVVSVVIEEGHMGPMFV